MANKKISLDALGQAVSEILTIYSTDVENAVEKATKESINDLVRKTKATAPVRYRGKFKRAIASKKLDSRRGSKYVWYVKAPEHRLTHLVVHGHAKRNGGRTRGNPFLQNALNEVLPEYEHKIEEAVGHESN